MFRCLELWNENYKNIPYENIKIPIHDIMDRKYAIQILNIGMILSGIIEKHPETKNDICICMQQFSQIVCIFDKRRSILENELQIE